MKALFVCSLSLMVVFCGTPLTTKAANSEPQIFTLPDARADESYRVEVEALLRDKYRLRLEASSRNAILQWALADGDLPAGLVLRPDGTLIGVPQESRPQPYRFRLKVVDASVLDEALTLDCILNVKALGLRLVKINGPMLVPLEGDRSQADLVSAKPASAGNDNSTPTPENLVDHNTGGSTPQGAEGPITWVEPDVGNGATIQNLTQSSESLAIKIDPATHACLLDILVLRKNNLGADSQLVDHQTKKVDFNQKLQKFQVNLARGDNHVIVATYKKEKDADKCELDTNVGSLQAVGSTLTLTAGCEGENCGKVAKAEEPNSALSDRNMRAILGIEQSGASSSASAQNPFVDFFFNAQLSQNRWLAWGDIRLTTTPQQVAAFASSATNAVGAATGDKINDLATSFDFKIGPEFQFNPSASTRLSLIAGFGAISTLTGPPKGAPIFKLPVNTSTQYANFVNQYPEAKTPGAAYIAFVPEEQDRFFRQYFVRLRVRSYHKEQFPSIFDVTFGQNSAVTGGMLRHFVLGFEGSHHIPLINNSIYIFGSANLKLGGPKFRSTPFVLDPAETTVKLSDPTVVITSRQSNRDFYRIGFGIDLIGLFKSSDKKKE